MRPGIPILVAVVVLVAPAVVALAAEVPGVVVPLPHGPIAITDDDGFLDPVALSGVVGGTGTAGDPYVIAGWIIAADGAVPAIRLVNTTAHVVIRDNRFPASGLPYYANDGNIAVWLANASHVRVESNRFDPMYRGMVARDVTDLTIAGNGFSVGDRGLMVERGTGVELDGNTFSGGSIGADVEAASNLRILRNTVNGVGLGMTIRGSRELVAEENLFLGGTTGAIDEEGGDSTWARNTFRNQVSAHLRIHYASGIRVIDNTFSGAAYALFMFFSGANVILGNDFENHVAAIDARFAVENEADGNTIRSTNTPFLGLARQRFAFDTNTVDGYPLYYVRDPAGAALDLGGSTAAGVVAYGTPGFILTNGTVLGQGVTIEDSDRAAVRGITAIDAYTGLRIAHSTNAHVANVTLSGNTHGMILVNVSASTIRDSTVTDGVGGIIVISGSRDNLIDRVHVARTRDGVQFSGGAHGNTLRGSLLESNHGTGFSAYAATGSRVESVDIAAAGTGLLLVATPPVTFRDVAIDGARYGVNLVRSFDHDLDETVTVAGAPVRIVHGLADATLTPATFPAGYLALVNATNVTVTGYTFARNADGLMLVDPEAVQVTGNTFRENSWGVFVDGTRGHATLSGNRFEAQGVNLVFLAPGNYTAHGNDLLRPNDLSLHAERGTRVDARDNWWSTPLGPAGLTSRGMNGRMTVEAGPYRPQVSLAPVNEDVDFAPWSTAAHGAGSG